VSDLVLSSAEGAIVAGIHAAIIVIVAGWMDEMNLSKAAARFVSAQSRIVRAAGDAHRSDSHLMMTMSAFETRTFGGQESREAERLDQKAQDCHPLLEGRMNKYHQWKSNSLECLTYRLAP
jgi:hypothetical protein